MLIRGISGTFRRGIALRMEVAFLRFWIPPILLRCLDRLMSSCRMFVAILRQRLPARICTSIYISWYLNYRQKKIACVCRRFEKNRWCLCLTRHFQRRKDNISGWRLLEEHDIVYRHVPYTILFIYLGLVGEDDSLMDIVFFLLQELRQGAMLRVILTGLNLNRQDLHRIGIVDEIVYFALFLVVVVLQLKSVCAQLLCNYRFIDRTKIDTPLIQKDGIDIDVV